MNQPKTEKCGNCYFYRKEKIGEQIFRLCKRFPPTTGAVVLEFKPGIVGGAPIPRWDHWKTRPFMSSDDWCGEWKEIV